MLMNRISSHMGMGGLVSSVSIPLVVSSAIATCKLGKSIYVESRISPVTQPQCSP